MTKDESAALAERTQQEALTDAQAHTALGARGYREAYDAGYRAATSAANSTAQPSDDEESRLREANRLLVGMFKADDKVIRSMWAQDLKRHLGIRWGEPATGNTDTPSALAAPTQAPMQPSAAMPSELAAFEAWYVDRFKKPLPADYAGMCDWGTWQTAWRARLAAPTQAAPAASSITIDFRQATDLLEMFGGEPTEIMLMTGDGHSGNGLYAVYNADPEGSVFLGETDEDAIPAAPAAAVEPKPERYCNKCGYFGPDQMHQRPNGSGECNYISTAIRAAAVEPKP